MTGYPLGGDHAASAAAGAARIVVIDAVQAIVQGTADELNDRMGGDVLKARAASPTDLQRAPA